MNRSRNPFLPPYLNSSHADCGMVSQTDSCSPRRNVLMHDVPVAVGPSSQPVPGVAPNPYLLSTSASQCMPSMSDVP